MSFEWEWVEAVEAGKCLKEKGFKFDRVNTFMRHAPAGTDTAELEAMMDEYGFIVEKYDGGVDEDED